MDIRNLTTFVQVAELGSFSRAAQALGYSQPSISVQIRQLEQELGFQLFDRIGHAVRLTDKGRDALVYAQQVCRLCREMAKDSPEGEKRDVLIRLAASDSLSAYLLEERFSLIRKRYSGIRLSLTAAGTDELFRLLNHNEVDLVYTLDSHIYDADYVIAGDHNCRREYGVTDEQIIGVLTAGVIAGFMFLFGRGIIGSFISGTPEEVAAATQIGWEYLRLMSLCLPVLYLLHIYRSALQGMGNTVMPMSSGIAEFIMRTLSAFLLPGLIGYPGVFWAEILAWAGADLILMPSYYADLRKLQKSA